MTFFRQSNPYECGPACLASVASRYGIPVSVSKIAKVAGTSINGTSLEGLQLAGQSLGLDVKVMRGDQGSVNSKLPVPLIAHLDRNGGDSRIPHYVVVTRIGKRKIIVHDPLDGKKEWTYEYFFSRWSGFIIFTSLSSRIKATQGATRVWSQYLPLLRPHIKSLVVVGIASVLLIVFGVLNSFYFLFLINQVIPAKAELTLHVLSIGVIILTILRISFEAIRKHLVLHCSQKIDLSLVFSYLRHVLNLPMAFYDRLRTGDVVARLDDIQLIRSTLADVTVSVVMDTLMVVFIGAILFFQSSLLFWIALVTGILSSLVAWVYSGYFSKQQRQLMSDRSSIHSFLIEVLTGYGTIKAMNAVEYVYDEFEKRQMESVWTNHKFSIGQNIQSSLVSFIDGAGGNVLYWMGCLLILKDQFTLGQLISFNVLLVYFLGPLKRLLKLQPNLQGAMVAAERLNQILSIEPEIPENGSWLKPTRFFGKLEFRNVFFQYAANSPVLRNVSLSIEAGQRVAIVGSSGCGKTTILRLLMKFYRPLSGSIMIDGHNIQDVDTMHLRSRIGYVPQEIFLISGSITDNIALHRSDASIEEIVEASRKAGAHEFIERLPNRYNTIIGERGTMFSGGERQRLALARALLGDPDILVLDEATSNLDSISERRMHLTLENLRSEKKTTILVAHRLSTVVGCDKIFVIDKGNIIEYGNHTELIAGNGYYAKLWEMNTV